MEIISKVITVMLRKLNLEENEILDFTDQVRERKMGELFENFRGYDVPAVRREAKAEEHDTLLIKKVCIKLEKGKTMEQMADELEEDMGTITKICSAIEKAGTHDATAVFEMMNQKQKSCS